MSTAERRALTRRHLIQASTAALALAAAWTPTTHAWGTSADRVVAGNTAFALALYDQLRQDADGNLLVSPCSISLALAMTYAGAAGETATQMAETLGFDADPADLADAFRTLSDDIVERGNAEEDANDGDPARGLTIANALWGEQTFPFSDAYLEQLEDGFGAGLNLVDFTGDPAEARDEINEWVADKTEDRIEDIVPPDAITEATRLVLANAIWFSGPWQATFDPESTEDGDFTLLDGSPVTVPFMFQHESLPYAEGDGFQAIELPYDGSGFAFTILLPDEGEFESFEEGLLDADALQESFDDLEVADVELSMPRFSFEFATSLVDPLTALGMEDAFDPDRADFSGMVDDDTADPLVIGDVLHKAFIALDENGTEAAAATIVEMEATAMEPSEDLIEVRVDRPFVFAIRDTETGTLLFLGRVLDPS
jgi:serpin B